MADNNSNGPVNLSYPIGGKMKDEYECSPAVDDEYDYKADIVKDIDVTNKAPVPKGNSSMSENK